MTAYQKYVNVLRNGCSILQTKLLPAIAQAPLAETEEDVDARIKAVEAAIQYLQDSKRSLLYLKNRMGRPNVL